MADTQLEQRRRCPRCSEPGEQTSEHGVRGGKVITMTCRTEACKWFNTSWIYQVNADGSLPERKQGEKEFPTITPGEEAMARAMIEDLEGRDLRDTGPGTYGRN